MDVVFLAVAWKMIAGWLALLGGAIFVVLGGVALACSVLAGKNAIKDIVDFIMSLINFRGPGFLLLLGLVFLVVGVALTGIGPL